LSDTCLQLADNQLVVYIKNGLANLEKIYEKLKQIIAIFRDFFSPMGLFS